MSSCNFEVALHRIQLLCPKYSWDDYGTLYTDAFWRLQYEIFKDDSEDVVFQNGAEYNYIDEVVACLLGGYGFKAEVGWAAYERLKSRNLIRQGVDFDSIFSALSEPLRVENKWVHYRFPNQKSKYVYKFLCRADLDNAPIDDDLSFRDWLLSIKGIGLKTASWITRNYLHSDKVAIIDIHLYRAGILTGFVKSGLSVQKDYYEIENCFLEYCQSLQVKPSIMDMVMWSSMKSTNKIAISLINKV